VEFYRSHEDFSVRTVGLSGLGALGVTFGRVVAMDSPAARKIGEFNWGSTLWHELAHVFTLGASDNRVPRWFSEGLSVYEEHRARPAWGADASPLFVAAYAGGQLPKVSHLNDGFMRPRYPAQISLSYYMASLVCEMIEKEHGIAAIRAMLTGYRDGKTTDQVMRDVLKTEPAAFDARFDAWVRQRFARELASVTPLQVPRDSLAERTFTVRGEYVGTLETARALLDSNKVDAAIPLLEKAKAMFPGYAGGDSPYAMLAHAHQLRGEARQAAAELATLTSINEEAYTANVALSGMLDTLGDARGSEAALERTLWISPFDPAVHERLARVATGVGDRALVVQERRALVALDPVDRVEALYQLALAYAEAGDATSARREVLRALELAPNFEKAQELLLRLRRPAPGGTLP
jgi:tetratricopeptide (TPR) repeat protein